MTTPLFVEVAGEAKVETFLKGISGAYAGPREVVHNEELKVKVAATSPGIWDPSKHAEIQAAGLNRALVMWGALAKYAFVPGPGCFGRVVTLHVGWVPPGHEDPKTAAEFRRLPGYEVCVFGGQSDPQFNRGWRDVPFSTSRHKVIISNVVKVSSCMKLAWWFDEEDVGMSTGTTRGSGPRFFLRIEGTCDVYGGFV